MSFYATIQGRINFPNQERLNMQVANLVERGYMVANSGDKNKTNYKFVDECDNIVNKQHDSDAEGLTLNIPLSLYRNLTRLLCELTQETTCKFVWTSTDGCFDGGVIKNGTETTYDLIQWAKENMPEEDSDAPDFNQEFESYCDWMQEVEIEFHNEMFD